MPFTAFHMGVGIVARAAHKDCSLVAFGIANVLMDVEPLYRLLRGDTDVHGISHTLLGATAIALATAATKPVICRFLSVRWRQVAVGSFVGTYSHLLLDGFLHQDMGLPWLGMLTWAAVEGACVALGAVGAFVLWRRGVVLDTWEDLKRSYRQ